MSGVNKYIPSQEDILHGRARAKKWREDNLEYRKQYEKEYYEDNRMALIEKALVNVTCDLCGSVVCKNFIAQHKRTIKCKTLNEKKNEII